MSGTVISTYTSVGVSVTSASQEPVSVTSAGTISAPDSPSASFHYGVYVVGFLPGTLTNYGLISGFQGIIFNDGGTIINGGSIFSPHYGVDLEALTTPATLINSGTISSSSAPGFFGVTGVRLGGNGVIVNGSSTAGGGLILGPDGAIFVDGLNQGAGFDEILNYGTLLSSGNNSAIDINLLGTDDAGFVTNGSASLTSAVIEGGAGVVIGSPYLGAQFANFGTIIGTVGAGVGIEHGTLTNGAVNDDGAFIQGGSYGVSVGGTTVNYGTIVATGAGSAGLTSGFDFPLSIYNVGSLSVIEGNGTGIKGYGGVGGILTNYGTVAATGPDGIGIDLEPDYGSHPGPVIIFDGGTISGSQFAIVSNPGPGNPGYQIFLVVEPGAVFDGAVFDQGTGDLILAGNSPGSLDMGASFSNFAAIIFSAGSTWTLEGQLADFHDGDPDYSQTISGFSVNDSIILEGYLANSGTYVNGTGLVLSYAGNSDETLGLTGNFSKNAFDVTTDGTNTTIALFDQIGAGAVTVGAGSIVSNPSIASGGDVSVQSGGTVSNALIAGGTLELGVGSAIIGDISFSGQGGLLIIDGDAALPNTIAGLTVGDKIELAGVAFVGTGGVYGTADEDTYTVATAGTLSIDADGTDYNLIIAGITVGQDNFVLSGDLGITETACYVAGTRIATAVGEAKVEDLAIGDLVETLHAGLQKIKWIGRRSYGGRFIAGNKDMLPISIKQDAISESVPARDLFVSPGHAICIDGSLIHAFRLVNSVSITQAAAVESVTYYHIETENHEVIFAENCPAETFIDENFRAQFQNAAEYRALYPGQSAESIACLPRLEDGFLLHAIRQRLNARAGILPAPEMPGALRGYVDVAGPTICSGWAQDIENPETPVCLDILVDGARVARALANFYRADLREADLGSGCHAFCAALPAGYAGQVQVRRAIDGTELPWTETALSKAA